MSLSYVKDRILGVNILFYSVNLMCILALRHQKTFSTWNFNLFKKGKLNNLYTSGLLHRDYEIRGLRLWVVGGDTYDLTTNLSNIVHVPVSYTVLRSSFVVYWSKQGTIPTTSNLHDTEPQVFHAGFKCPGALQKRKRLSIHGRVYTPGSSR